MQYKYRKIFLRISWEKKLNKYIIFCSLKIYLVSLFFICFNSYVFINAYCFIAYIYLNLLLASISLTYDYSSILCLNAVLRRRVETMYIFTFHSSKNYIVVSLFHYLSKQRNSFHTIFRTTTIEKYALKLIFTIF